MCIDYMVLSKSKEECNRESPESSEISINPDCPQSTREDSRYVNALFYIYTQ